MSSCSVINLTHIRLTNAYVPRTQGGFQGRANKLVDACYSFWVGALFPLLAFALAKSHTAGPSASNGPSSDLAADSESDEKTVAQPDWMFKREQLQKYVLMCCQSRYGGLIDKPVGAHAHIYTYIHRHTHHPPSLTRLNPSSLATCMYTHVDYICHLSGSYLPVYMHTNHMSCVLLDRPLQVWSHSPRTPPHDVHVIYIYAYI